MDLAVASDLSAKEHAMDVERAHVCANFNLCWFAAILLCFLRKREQTRSRAGNCSLETGDESKDPRPLALILGTIILHNVIALRADANLMNNFSPPAVSWSSVLLFSTTTSYPSLAPSDQNVSHAWSESSSCKTYHLFEEYASCVSNVAAFTKLLSASIMF